MQLTDSQLFLDARSHKKFKDTPVSLDTLQSVYELTKMAPTANNCCPLRIVFVTSKGGLSTLAASAHGYNKEKVETAPAAAILAYDMRFYDHFAKLAPHLSQPPSQAQWPEDRIEKTAITSANIQAGFFLIAARAHGLDCGPMAGFDAEPIEQAFFDVPSWRFGWVVLLGEGDPDALYPRADRLAFETACKVV